MLRSSQHNRGRGVGLARHPSTVEGVGHEEKGHHEDYEPSDLALDQVRGVLLLRLLGLARLKQVKVLHVRGEDGGDSDAREDAHDRGQDQHQSHHHTLCMC